MTNTQKPRMPRGLGTEGQKLWKSVVEEFDLLPEPHKQRILFDACRTADTIKRLDDAVNKEALTVRGSMGQPVINPCLAQAQTARGLLAQLLGKLGLPETDEAIETQAQRVSDVRRTAAKQGKFKVVK